jgi:putative chitinase
MISFDQFMACTSSSRENAMKYYQPTLDAMKRFDISTPKRIAGFLAQIAHESGNLARLEENLNYSAEGLMRVWPSRFPTLASASRYHRNPRLIANKVYSSRMGNGDEASGDGWKYRGRGLKQLTGKDNYRRASSSLGVDLVENPDALLTPQYAALSAAWFWSVNGLNAIADGGTIEAMTKKINGGLIGIEDRRARYQKALRILGVL